ncbi:M17L2 protein, partial [Drymodes brunneopygia]|nr:M17L2 protein [Drymodes brunneopygia]
PQMLGRSWRSLFAGRLLLLTNTLSCGGLLAAGDCLQQHWHRRKHPDSQLQLGRTGEHWEGRGGHLLLCPGTFPGNSHREFPTLPSPLTPPVPAAIGTLEGQSLQESWDELKEKFWEFYKADWSIWPAAQILNFLFVPPAYRVVYVNVVTLGWDTYLSYLKHRVS